MLHRTRLDGVLVSTPEKGIEVPHQLGECKAIGSSDFFKGLVVPNGASVAGGQVPRCEHASDTRVASPSVVHGHRRDKRPCAGAHGPRERARCVGDSIRPCHPPRSGAREALHLGPNGPRITDRVLHDRHHPLAQPGTGRVSNGGHRRHTGHVACCTEASRSLAVDTADPRA